MAAAALLGAGTTGGVEGAAAAAAAAPAPAAHAAAPDGPSAGPPGAGALADAEPLDEEAAAELEEALADALVAAAWSTRVRVRGASADPHELALCGRVLGQIGSRAEVWLLSERDAGEPGWSDFRAGYLHLRAGSGPADIVIGDLLPGWGAGLVCARSASMGALPLELPRADSRLLGFRSTSENRAIRGLAVRDSLGGWTLTALAGRAVRDGRLGDAGEVVSLPASGTHVTRAEVAGRDLFGMTVAGVRASRRARAWSWGASAIGERFDQPLDLRRPERKPWAFHGRQHGLAAVEGGVDRGSLRAQAEMALAADGHQGAVGLVQWQRRRSRWRLLARRFEPGFYSFFGGAASRNQMENERGIMLAGNGRGWQLYADRYRRPARTYYYPRPATLTTLGGRARWRPERRTAATLWLRRDRGPYWQQGGPVAQDRRVARLDIERGTPRRGALVRLRLDATRLRRRPGTDEWGCALSLLWRQRWRGGHLSLHGTRFATDSYHSAVYQYEDDLPGLATVRPLHGTGWRWYGMLSVDRGQWRVAARYRCERRGPLRHCFGLQVERAPAP